VIQTFWSATLCRRQKGRENAMMLGPGSQGGKGLSYAVAGTAEKEKKSKRKKAERKL